MFRLRCIISHMDFGISDLIGYAQWLLAVGLSIWLFRKSASKRDIKRLEGIMQGVKEQNQRYDSEVSPRIREVDNSNRWFNRFVRRDKPIKRLKVKRTKDSIKIKVIR